MPLAFSAEAAVSVYDSFAYLFGRIGKIFLSFDSAFSLTSLFCALCIAIVFLAVRRRRKNRPIRIRSLLRALFPERITASASHSVDVGYFFFNTLVFGLIFGWAILSYQFVSNAVIGRLVGAFGIMEPTSLPDLVSRIAITITLFLAYEFAYWLDHYLSHRVPVLWEFHKIHHEAEVLTPLTNARIHPVDGLVHANITALIMGVTNGAMNYLFGKTTYQYAIGDANLIFVLFVHAYVHLQHTHLWIPLRGVLGCIFVSPAHHQVHHSTNPIHFNKNLGSCLAIWDWLFGTLHIPSKEPEILHFGVEESPGVRRPAHEVHSMPRRLLEPFVSVLLYFRPMFTSRPSGQASEHAAPPAAEMPDAVPATKPGLRQQAS